MERQYAPVAGTAIRSPGAMSDGRNASLTTMSPLSQCLPTTRTSIGSASEVRAAGANVVAAMYTAARTLSDMPRSALADVADPNRGGRVATSYSFMAVGP